MARIMCTLTGAQITDAPELVGEMYSRGMRSVRINTAHLADTVQLDALLVRLKNDLPDVRVLIDTKGPELRTTDLVDDEPVQLAQGRAVTLRGTAVDADCDHTSRACIYVNYPMLHHDVSVGDTLLIDDATIALTVTDITGDVIHAIVDRGGQLGARKGVVVKDRDIDLPAVSARDRAFIVYASQSDLVDEVAHSFVRSAADVLAVKDCMASGKQKPVIAKIENRQGIANLLTIIDVSDGVLIARGDLTASIGSENIPAAQQYIATAVKSAGKPLYLATNILPSMMHGAEPSADDLAGISRAVAQGVDVMLLTNETASGEYPALVVETLAVALKS